MLLHQVKGCPSFREWEGHRTVLNFPWETEVDQVVTLPPQVEGEDPEGSAEGVLKGEEGDRDPLRDCISFWLFPLSFTLFYWEQEI